MLIARIHEVFPLVCPICGGQMHIIAFITHSADIRRILNHIGVKSQPRTLLRRVGHRCGMIVMRRRVRAPKLSQIGTWPHNQHKTAIGTPYITPTFKVGTRGLC
jgi:hypothetical protein